MATHPESRRSRIPSRNYAAIETHDRASKVNRRRWFIRVASSWSILRPACRANNVDKITSPDVGSTRCSPQCINFARSFLLPLRDPIIDCFPLRARILLLLLSIAASIVRSRTLSPDSRGQFSHGTFPWTFPSDQRTRGGNLKIAITTGSPRCSEPLPPSPPRLTITKFQLAARYGLWRNRRSILTHLRRDRIAVIARCISSSRLITLLLFALSSTRCLARREERRRLNRRNRIKQTKTNNCEWDHLWIRDKFDIQISFLYRMLC